MKKNKGFTLVELLAVIAILAILVIIALPNVMGMFNDAKENSFMTECKQIYKVAQQQYINDSMFETSERTYARCETQNCGTELQLSGRTNLNYFIKFNKGGDVVEFYASDGTYQYSYNENEPLLITSIDKENIEQIALLEENEIIELRCDGIYKEPEEITLCLYYETSTSNPEYVSRNVTCMDNQTLGECLGTTNDVYYYSQDFRNCINTHSIEVWACGVSNTSRGYLVVNNCYNSYANRRQVSCDENASGYKNGCLSLNAKGRASGCCLDGECLVDTWDEKKKKRVRKKLKDVTYDDLVLAWNFDEGKAEWVKPFWIMQPFEFSSHILLTFDDGSNLKVVVNHRIFDYDNGYFERVSNIEKGFRTINADGKVLVLESKKVINELSLACNIITEKTINLFVDGILTSRGSNNMYEIKDMKFVKDDKEKITKEDLSGVSDEYFEALRLGERSVDMYGSKEQTIEHINKLVSELIENRQK